MHPQNPTAMNNVNTRKNKINNNAQNAATQSNMPK